MCMYIKAARYYIDGAAEYYFDTSGALPEPEITKDDIIVYKFGLICTGNHTRGELTETVFIPFYMRDFEYRKDLCTYTVALEPFLTETYKPQSRLAIGAGYHAYAYGNDARSMALLMCGRKDIIGETVAVGKFVIPKGTEFYGGIDAISGMPCFVASRIKWTGDYDICYPSNPLMAVHGGTGKESGRSKNQY